MLRVETIRTKRYPLFRCVPGEVVLGQIRSVIRCADVIVYDRHVTGKATTSQHLGSSRARGARPDDYNFAQWTVIESPWIGWRQRITLDLLTKEDAAAPSLDLPVRNGIERWRAERFAAPKAETGVVPGATHRV